MKMTCVEGMWKCNQDVSLEKQVKRNQYKLLVIVLVSPTRPDNYQTPIID